MIKVPSFVILYHNYRKCSEAHSN